MSLLLSLLLRLLLLPLLLLLLLLFLLLLLLLLLLPLLLPLLVICNFPVQREVAEHIVASLDAGGGSMDQLCRLLLAADSYSVVLLRNYCLAGLAQAFHSLQRHTAREQAIFEAFVEAVAPKVSLYQCCWAECCA